MGTNKHTKKELTGIRMPPKLKESCRLLADEEGLTLSEWVREVLRQRVRHRVRQQRQSA